MLQAIESLLPIVALISLGAALFRGHFFNEEVRAGFDKFAYWIALPSLFIQQLAGTDFSGLTMGPLLTVLIATSIIIAIIAHLLAKAMRLSPEFLGVFIQASFRGNLAFVGLPLIVFALAQGESTATDSVAMTLVALAALIPVSNALSVLVLLASQDSLSLRFIPRLLKNVLFNPLIISALLGGALGLLQWRLPTIIDRPLALLGQTALAIALVSLGAALSSFKVRGHLTRATFASLIKVVLMPAITYALCVVLTVPPEQRFIAMILSACPVAAASFVLATQLGGNKGFAAASVLISTILSLGSLTVILIYFH